MDKQIPIYFDTTIIESPIQKISDNLNVGRLKVRVFTKYGNRNGSYITDEVSAQLIESAISGTTPVVGFFDPETQNWASHTGPTLANAYGYVEDFLGWEPFTDTDGVTRDYAVFSVILFTEYFEEAKKIMGQNQSMELDVSSITGEWVTLNDQEYYVYKTAKILGLCVIGSHEPCFSVSSFFSKDDDMYKAQYDKFSSLLSELKEQVEEITKQKGGEQPMDEFEEKVEEVVEEAEVEDNSTPEGQPAEETSTIEISLFEDLQRQFDELKVSYNALQESYNKMENLVKELQDFQAAASTEIDSLKEEKQTLLNSITEYEAKIQEYEKNRKYSLIEKYEKIIDEEEISQVREQVNDYSYDELESKLAITFANKQMTTGSEVNKVPLPEPQESQFALLMKKYRKN